MRTDPYFRGPDGTAYPFAVLASRVRTEAPETLGAHISVQLAALGLLDAMHRGSTPCMLPYTFADSPRRECGACDGRGHTGEDHWPINCEWCDSPGKETECRTCGELVQACSCPS